MDELLTEDEHHALAVTAELTLLFARIIGGGPTRVGDINEVVEHIHVLQRMLMGQAAARAYPTLYRLLGETAGPEPPGA